VQYGNDSVSLFRKSIISNLIFPYVTKSSVGRYLCVHAFRGRYQCIPLDSKFAMKNKLFSTEAIVYKPEKRKEIIGPLGEIPNASFKYSNTLYETGKYNLKKAN
jgi:hypothetical protein